MHGRIVHFCCSFFLVRFCVDAAIAASAVLWSALCLSKGLYAAVVRSHARMAVCPLPQVSLTLSMLLASIFSHHPGTHRANDMCTPTGLSTVASRALNVSRDAARIAVRHCIRCLCYCLQFLMHPAPAGLALAGFGQRPFTVSAPVGCVVVLPRLQLLAVDISRPWRGRVLPPIMIGVPKLCYCSSWIVDM